MAIALVGSAKASAFSTTVSVTRATVAGNLLVAIVQHQSRTTGFTITDNTGGTWTLAATTITPGSTSERLISVYYRLNAPVVTTVTVTYAAGNTGLGLIVEEYSGATSIRASNATSTGTDPKRSLVTAAVNDTIVSAIGYAGSAAATVSDSGYSAVNSTNISTTWLGATRRIAVPSAGSQGPTWVGTGTSGIITLAIVPFVAAAPPTANAGPDQTVDPWSTVQLTANASTAGSSAITGYSWAGSGLPTLSGATPTFSAPPSMTGSTLTYTLTVTDGTLTSTDQVAITVRPAEFGVWVGSTVMPARFEVLS